MFLDAYFFSQCKQSVRSQHRGINGSIRGKLKVCSFGKKTAYYHSAAMFLREYTFCLFVDMVLFSSWEMSTPILYVELAMRDTEVPAE